MRPFTSPAGLAAPPLIPTLRYPITLLFTLQYSVLVILPAILNADSQLLGIVVIVAVAIGATAAVEHFLALHAPITSRGTSYRAPRPANLWIVQLTGAFATVGSALLGAGTYATQVGLTATSSVATLITPLQPWTLFGCAFSLVAWRWNLLSRRHTLILLSTGIMSELLYSGLTARLAPLMQFCLTIGLGCVLVGYCRQRYLWLGLLAAILVWPLLLTGRNDTRQHVDAQDQFIETNLDPSYRLREDLLLQQGLQSGPSIQVPLPGIGDMLRFGLVPRALDRNRGSLSTAQLLSVALGGNPHSSMTFTILGNVSVLTDGLPGTGLYAAATAAVCFFLGRRLTPIRMALVLLVAFSLVWIEAIYPDNIVGILQGLVSLSVACVILYAFSGRSAKAPSPAARARA